MSFRRTTPNAFATGRNPEHAAVAVTQGIRRILDRRELTGVLGHELSHVKDRDILVSSIAATLGRCHQLYRANGAWAAIFGGGSRDREEGGGNMFGLLFMMIVAPIAAMLIQMAVSRSREYMADESGAKVTGDPLALASALRKLQMGAQNIPMQVSDATATSTAHMFIVNPLSRRRDRQSFQHASANGRAHRPARGDGQRHELHAPVNATSDC